ncbi:hypothetical protein GCM10010964_03290 [Caldovatus sediminis]|uniref:Uncharacterized protein n=1 Tax=Caldovatus sediminis TaxID=2041189 RepID=A0A8J2Z7J5_9PROT|nr:hypothetical protein GCM10010964_03290 [Caldovatus sediminis]
MGRSLPAAGAAGKAEAARRGPAPPDRDPGRPCAGIAGGAGRTVSCTEAGVGQPGSRPAPRSPPAGEAASPVAATAGPRPKRACPASGRRRGERPQAPQVSIAIV